MSSTRASEVAEALFELKRAGKVATYSAIAKRAGFSAGTTGRAMKTALKTVRRDWPHLQWWRAIDDNATIEKGGEQEEMLRELGVEIEESASAEEELKVAIADELVMNWAEGEDEQNGEATSG